MDFLTEYYSGQTDANVLKDVIGDKSSPFLSLVVQKAISSIYTLATTTFSIPTATFTVDALIGGYVLVQITAADVYYLPITDNTATSITVDPTDSMREKDVSGDLVDATAYSVKVISDDRYMGETLDASLSPNVDRKEFVYGYPEQVGHEDIIRIRPEITVKTKTTGLSIKKDILRLINLNSSSVNFEHYATGGNSIIENEYLIIFKSQVDKGNKELRTVVLNCKIRITGEIKIDAGVDSWIEYDLMIKLFTESLCPTTENYFRIMKEK